MKKIAIAVSLVALCLFAGCGNSDIPAESTVAAATEATENPLLGVEEILQGSWEYYDEAVGLGEILLFDHGEVTYTSYLEDARDKDSTSTGTYLLTESGLTVIINGHETQFDYEVSAKRLAITRSIDSGYDKGSVRVYVQTDKAAFDPGRASVNRPIQSSAAPPEVPAENRSAEKESGSSFASSGERNALESAKSYLRFMAFSYTGLIDQLEYEGYSYSEAKYAVDNCGADWYEQAVKCAESYLEYMSFSRSGLIEQLEYEGFTHDQAVYGVDQAY